MSFFFQIRKFEKLETDEERIKLGKEIYDQFIMKELLSQSHASIQNITVMTTMHTNTGDSFIFLDEDNVNFFRGYLMSWICQSLYVIQTLIKCVLH